MGCVQSYITTSLSERKARKTALAAKLTSDVLTKQLHAQRFWIREERTFLVFEHGVSSGKAMVLDKMKQIEGNEYSNAERSTFRELIISNTIHSVCMILEALPHLEFVLPPHLNNAAATLLSLPRVNRFIAQDVANALRSIWRDPVVQEASKRGSEFRLDYNAIYYLDSIERILEADYQPTREDIMRCRVGLTGVIEMSFWAQPYRYTIYDIGPQDRNPATEKFIRSFVDVQAVMFFVNLCDYDQYDGGGSTNRIDDALAIFKSIYITALLRRSDIIIFFTHKDDFVEKLSSSPIGNHFSDYNGGNNSDEAYRYISNRFTQIHGHREVGRQLLTWFISADDPPGRLNTFLVDYLSPRIRLVDTHL